MKREVFITMCYLVIVLLVVVLNNISASAATLLGRGGEIEYEFSKEWRAEYLDHTTYGTEKDLVDIYWDDDEMFVSNGTYYLDNPDRGFQMVPLYFNTEWERKEFEKDFMTYVTEYSQGFVKAMNNPYDTGCKWGFYLYNGLYWVYKYDL